MPMRASVEKKRAQSLNLLDFEILSECCTAMQAVLRKQKRKVPDFQRRKILMKGLS